MYRSQDFVVNVYESQGLLGLMGVGGRHGSHGMSLVQDLPIGQDVVAHEAEIVDGAFRQVLNLARGLLPVGGGDHRLDSRRYLGLAGIDGLDPRVGVGAAQYLPVQKPWKNYIRAIFRLPGYLIGPVVADRPGAHHFVIPGG